MHRKPFTILGSSDGCRGSTAIFTTEMVLKLRGRKMLHPSTSTSTTVAVFRMGCSIPSMSTQFPAIASRMGMRSLAWGIYNPVISFTTMSSSSSTVYASPRTFTRELYLSVPLITRPQAKNVEASEVWNNFVTITIVGPSDRQSIMFSANSSLISPEYRSLTFSSAAVMGSGIQLMIISTQPEGPPKNCDVIVLSSGCTSQLYCSRRSLTPISFRSESNCPGSFPTTWA
mmetsp:Transcript_99757/g.171863  ORF Transcript_99757/g.171863 Transcript_99757/m.171863 type:complete len:229 (-) Transcript_99757:1172-1858(-)